MTDSVLHCDYNRSEHCVARRNEHLPFPHHGIVFSWDMHSDISLCLSLAGSLSNSVPSPERNAFHFSGLDFCHVTSARFSARGLGNSAPTHSSSTRIPASPMGPALGWRTERIHPVSPDPEGKTTRQMLQGQSRSPAGKSRKRGGIDRRC